MKERKNSWGVFKCSYLFKNQSISILFKLKFNKAILLLYSRLSIYIEVNRQRSVWLLTGFPGGRARIAVVVACVLTSHNLYSVVAQTAQVYRCKLYLCDTNAFYKCHSCLSSLAGTTQAYICVFETTNARLSPPPYFSATWCNGRTHVLFLCVFILYKEGHTATNWLQATECVVQFLCVLAVSLVFLRFSRHIRFRVCCKTPYFAECFKSGCTHKSSRTAWCGLWSKCSVESSLLFCLCHC